MFALSAMQKITLARLPGISFAFGTTPHHKRLGSIMNFCVIVIPK